MTDLRKSILENCKPQFSKVAMIIVRTAYAAGEDNEEFHQKVADEIALLIEDGLLIAQGDISQWRRSEVRLALHGKPQ